MKEKAKIPAMRRAGIAQASKPSSKQKGRAIPAISTAQKQDIAKVPREDIPGLETGILSLLSFLGHSFKKGALPNDLYERERAAALRNLEAVRSLDAAEGADDFDSDGEIGPSKKQTLRKNKHDIESLLSFLEDSYNEGAISDKSYQELKSENVKKLGRINKLLSGAFGEATLLESPLDVYDKFSDGSGGSKNDGEIAGDDAQDGGGEEGGDNFSAIKPYRKMNFQSQRGSGRGESEGGNATDGSSSADGDSDDDPDADPYPGRARENDYASARPPQLDEGPAVKPISFKERLAAFSSRGISRGRAAGSNEADEILDALKLRQNKDGRESPGENEGEGFGGKYGTGADDAQLQENDFESGGKGGLDAGQNEYSNEDDAIFGQDGGLAGSADDIMQSLKIIPNRGARERNGASDIANGAESMATNSKNEVQVRAGALLGKLGGIMGKFKKQQGGSQGGAAKDGQNAAGSQSGNAQSGDAADEGANSNPASSSTQGGAPSWADKLPEEMNPQELAEYNKSRQQAELEASGNAPAPIEESPSPSASANSGPSGDEGGASSAEVAKLALELEKFKAKMETVENTRTVVEERIEHIMENIGELRTMLFEKESSTKEQESKLDKFVEMVSDLEPQRFAKELDKRDRQIGEEAMKVEKLETITADMAQTLSRVRSMLEAIGSLKNIATVSKDIADRSAKIDNTVSKIERLADETGRVYVELGRKLNEFTLYRGKQDIMAESLKELVGMTENMGNKIDNYATRDDLEGLKRALEDSKLTVLEIEAKMELASEGDELPGHIKDLQEEKEGLEQILESNEEEYIEGKIKEAEYKKMKDTHTKKLQTLRLRLKSELSKIHSEKVTQLQKAREISKGITDENAPEAQSQDQEGAAPSQNMGENPQSESEEGGLENGADANLEGQAPPVAQGKQMGKSQIPKSQLVPKKITKDAIQSQGANGRIAGASKARPPLQNNAPLPVEDEAQGEPLDAEIDGEVDDAALEHAEETSQMEDELAESTDGEADGEGEMQSEIEMPIPMAVSRKGQIAQKIASGSAAIPKRQFQLGQSNSHALNSKTAQSAPKTQIPILPLKILANKASGPQTSPNAPAARPLKTPGQKTIANPPTLSLKKEKPLPPRGVMRIFDVIKGASEGKKIALQAQATTIKKGAMQCLIKLEDESGVIYGTFASGLKGGISLQGIVAKDPQGVPYIKISRAE